MRFWDPFKELTSPNIYFSMHIAQGLNLISWLRNPEYLHSCHTMLVVSFNYCSTPCLARIFFIVIFLRSYFCCCSNSEYLHFHRICIYQEGKKHEKSAWEDKKTCRLEILTIQQRFIHQILDWSLSNRHILVQRKTHLICNQSYANIESINKWCRKIMWSLPNACKVLTLWPRLIGCADQKSH